MFFRSDESGTTENFTKWLHAAAPDAWTADPGKQWTGKGEGKEKSAGVADGVNTTEGGITYVEWSYAKDAKLGMAQVDNGGGPVELTADTVAKSVATATQVGTGNDLALKLDYATKEPGAYPVILVTYEIVCSKGLDADKTALAEVLPDALLRHASSSRPCRTWATPRCPPTCRPRWPRPSRRSADRRRDATPPLPCAGTRERRLASLLRQGLRR